MYFSDDDEWMNRSEVRIRNNCDDRPKSRNLSNRRDQSMEPRKNVSSKPVPTGVKNEIGQNLYCHYDLKSENYVTGIITRTAIVILRSKIRIDLETLRNMDSHAFEEIDVEIINGSHFNGIGCFLTNDNI